MGMPQFGQAAAEEGTNLSHLGQNMEIMPHFLRMYSSFSIPLRDASRGAGLCIFSQQAEYADERSNAADDPECDEGGIRGSVADGEEELDALRDVALGDELDCAEDFCNREAGECRRQECGEYEDGLEAAAAERMKALDHERECGKRIEDTRQEEEEEVRADREEADALEERRDRVQGELHDGRQGQPRSGENEEGAHSEGAPVNPALH